jgi:hypothetical protein
MTTMPGRSKSVAQAVASVRNQERRPDHIIVSAAVAFTRLTQVGEGARMDFAALSERTGSDVEVLKCPHDHGPGTKLLCALPRLRQLAAQSGGSLQSSFVALVDDDLVYRRWALTLLELAIRDDMHAERHAYSYDVYTLTGDGRSVTAAQYPGLLVGSGHSLFAFRLSLLEGVEEFYECLHALEPLAAWHDDVWLSMFVQDLKRQALYRIGGTPFETAAREFPDSHAPTVSIGQPYALARPRRKTNQSVASPRTAPPNTSTPSPPSMADRDELNAAMARLRLRVTSEGRCGVPRNSSLCVGAWCVVTSRKEWGAHTSRMPWELAPPTKDRRGVKQKGPKRRK